MTRLICVITKWLSGLTSFLIEQEPSRKIYFKAKIDEFVEIIVIKKLIFENILKYNLICNEG